MKMPLHSALGRAALLAALVTACLDDRPTAPNTAFPVRLAFQANVIGAVAGEKVRIRTFYYRSDGSEVTLESTPTEVSITPGVSQTVAIQVRVAPCLADQQRETGDERTCEIAVDLSLVDEGGAVIDRYRSPLSEPTAPGASITIREPITLTSVGTVTIDEFPTFRVGDTHTLTATATDANGNRLERSFTWSSSNPNVVQIDAATGVATALEVGSTNVTATTGLRSATVALRVLSRISAVTLSPDPAPPVRAATTLTFVVTARDQNGANLGPITDRNVSWSVTNPAGGPQIASVSPDGVVTGLFPGDADITVSVDGIAATTRVRVIAGDIQVQPALGQLLIGGRTLFQARVVDANDEELHGVPVSWSSANSSIATVDDNGLVTGVATGETTVTVSGGGIDVAIPIRVGTLSLGVTPSGPTMVAGNSLQLNVSGAIGTVNWESTNPSVATVSQSGLVTARFPGTATINATVVTPDGTQRGSATVSVTAADLVITPPFATIFEFETFQFTATAYDSKGAVLDGLPVEWDTADPQTAPIGPDGVVFGAGVSEGGPVTITATAGGLTAVASIEILFSSSMYKAPNAGLRRTVAPAKTGKPPGT